MARVLLLAASAVALRPTLPKRSRIAPRASLTMHDYDYDVRVQCLNQIVAARRRHC